VIICVIKHCTGH